jgi:WD40 repeat protein
MAGRDLRWYRQADNFVFIISPDSVKSWMCGEEVKHAVTSKKRLITILYQSVERNELLPTLAELQWIDSPAMGFERTIERLITAIDTDLNWVREHTRFLVRAKEWEANNLDDGFLLHGMELKEAVRWLGQASAIQGRRPSELQEQYILASEKWEAGEIQRLKDLTEEKEQQRQEAERQSHIATARERVAFSALTLEEDPELSVLIAAEAVAGAWHSARTVLHETEEQLHRAVSASHVRLTLAVDDIEVSAVAWSPDGRRLATTTISDDGITRVTVWDATTGRQLRGLRNGQTLTATDAWRPNHQQRAALKRILARIRRTRKKLTSFVDAARRVLSIAWSPDGKQVATGGYAGDTAIVWDIKTGRELRTLSGHSGHILRIAWSPDGKQLATGSDDNTAKVWNVRTGKELCTLKGHAGRILSVAWSRDGKRLATGSNDNTIKLWDAKIGEELRALKGHRGSVRAIA